MDIFKELTLKETSTTNTNFRHKDFNDIKGILEFFIFFYVVYIYIYIYSYFIVYIFCS